LKSRPADTSAGIAIGLTAIPRITFQMSTLPSGFSASIASVGKARDAGSLITRTAANGRSFSSA